jgi:hypothetical protein
MRAGIRQARGAERRGDRLFHGNHGYSFKRQHGVSLVLRMSSIGEPAPASPDMR